MQHVISVTKLSHSLQSQEIWVFGHVKPKEWMQICEEATSGLLILQNIVKDDGKFA